MMRTLTERQVRLLHIALQIGKEKFRANSETIAHSGAAQQFADQARETEVLQELFAEAETVQLI